MKAIVHSTLTGKPSTIPIAEFPLTSPDAIARLISLIHGKDIEKTEVRSWPGCEQFVLSLEGGLAVYVQQSDTIWSAGPADKPTVS